MTYNKEYKKCLENIEKNLNEDDRRMIDEKYEQWRNGGRNGRISDLELAMFMSDKLDKITELMEASDKLSTRDGVVRHIERTTVTEQKSDPELKKEIDNIKSNIQELKDLIINKLS